MLQRRPTRVRTKPRPATVTTAANLRPAPIVAPIATTERERTAIAAALAIVAATEIASQPDSVQRAVRASMRARLRTRGTTIAKAFAAHSAAVAGQSHDAHAAAAWRTAVVTAASLLRPEPDPP